MKNLIQMKVPFCISVLLRARACLHKKAARILFTSASVCHRADHRIEQIQHVEHRHSQHDIGEQIARFSKSGTENVPQHDQRRPLGRLIHKHVILSGQLVEEIDRNHEHQQYADGLPKPAIGRTNLSAAVSHDKVADDPSMKDEAVDIHKVPERITGPVTEQQRRHSPRQERKCEHLPHQTLLRHACVDQHPEDREAAQMQRQILHHRCVHNQQYDIFINLREQNQHRKNPAHAQSVDFVLFLIVRGEPDHSRCDGGKPNQMPRCI